MCYKIHYILRPFPIDATINEEIHLFKVTYGELITQKTTLIIQFSSVAQSCLTLQPHEPQHIRPPCPSPTPAGHSNSCPLCR